MNKLFRMRELVEIINTADKAYFGEDKPIMTDKEYDALVEELTNLEKETGIHFKSSPIGKVGGEVKKGLAPVKHTKPMLSCNKTKDMGEFVRFIKENDVVLSWKMDGLTLVLRYENGSFRQALTRGSDGITGEDVTHTVTEMRNIPMHVPCKDTFEVRGEGVISFKDFNILTKLGDKSSHPRNVASGAVRSFIPDKGKLYHMDFFAFELIKNDAHHTKTEQLSFLKENNFSVVEHFLVESVKSYEEIEGAINKWVPADFAYPVDGIVAEYNDIKYGKSLGATAHHEKRMLALKWKDEVKFTKFKGVTLNTTRNGTVSIVGEFDEVLIDGTRIHRANLHNLSNFEKFGFGIGDVISVYKANMIIPQICENLTRSGTYKLPGYCPSCGTPLTVEVSVGGTRELYCPNTECIARNAHKIARFCDKQAMNIDGLSATVLEKMIAYGWIRNFKDIYNLKIHEDSIVSNPEFGIKKYCNIIEQIEKSRKCTMSRFLVGIGIPLLGPEAAKKLHQYFYGSMEEFETAIENGFYFNHIEGISENLNDAIHKWYENPFNQNTLHALMAELEFMGVKRQINGNANPFFDKVVVVTGTFEHLDRSNMLKLLESLGATTHDSVTKSTDFLIYGNLPGSKKTGQAIEYGVTMINEEKFALMLEQNR